MTVSTPKVWFSSENEGIPTWGNDPPSQIEKFRYLWVLVMSEGRREWETVKWIDVTPCNNGVNIELNSKV